MWLLSLLILVLTLIYMPKLVTAMMDYNLWGIKWLDWLFSGLLGWIPYIGDTVTNRIEPSLRVLSADRLLLVLEVRLLLRFIVFIVKQSIKNERRPKPNAPQSM